MCFKFTLLAASILGGNALVFAADEVKFNRDVLPILSDNCFYCHGPDSKHRQADLRLDIRAAAVDYGAIDEQDLSASLLIERILSDDPDIVMPPPDAHKTITTAEREILKQWLLHGAVYEPHWSYIPPTRPSLTKKNEDYSNPIDQLAADALAKHELTFTEPADPTTLVRRLCLDLTGIPPKPKQVADYVADPSPAATDELIETLLASPQFGERMANGWLDVVRYADTVGFHGDQLMHVWAYRDYVINAFNNNKPFDQFTIEQLAGDLLENPTAEQLTATCFNRLNMMTREGGAQPKEYLAKYAADRVRTVSMAFLGSTFGCAECHDHKFDPIATKDFYALSAYFADIKQWGVYTEYQYTPNKDLRYFTNEHPFPPEAMVPSQYLANKLESLKQQRQDALRNQASELQGSNADIESLKSWLSDSQDYIESHPSGWQNATPVALEQSQYTILDPAAVGSDARPTTDDYQPVQFGSEVQAESVTFDLPLGLFASLKLALLPTEQAYGEKNSVELSFIKKSSWGTHYCVPKFWLLKADGSKQQIDIQYATASYFRSRYHEGDEIDGIQSGWWLDNADFSKSIDSLWTLHTPIEVNQGDRLKLELPNNSVTQLAVQVSPLVASSPELNKLAVSKVQNVAPESNDLKNDLDIVDIFLRTRRSNSEVTNQLARLDSEIRNCRGGATPVLVVESAEPMITRVLARGNWQDDSGEIVEPQTPHFLPARESDGAMRQTRLDLAKWLVSEQNPLTSRVIMNRFWHRFFGFGLSERLDDFGAQGAAPTNPELLDWLAVEFRESGWDMKHMVRLMVSSQAYQQSAIRSERAAELDPDGRLLSHHQPHRLEAESIRDNALAIAGLLNLTPGGPPSKPYQPAGYYSLIQFPTLVYHADNGSLQYRRGIYTHWQRTFLHPMLLNFGAPTREDCIAMRSTANTPQQALTLLNDPSIVEAAKVFAKRITDKTAIDTVVLSRAYELAVARKPSDRELQSMLKLLAQLRPIYSDAPTDARALLDIGETKFEKSLMSDDAAVAELAAWTNVCRVILNLHETITVY